MHGQKVLYFRPSIGLQFPLSYLVDGSQADPSFKSNTYELYPEFAFNFQFDFNERWSIFTGWNNGGIGYSFSFWSYNKRVFRKFTTVGSAQRFPLGFQRYLTTVKWIKVRRRSEILDNLNQEIKNKNDMLYAILFRLKLTGGLSYDYYTIMSNDGEIYESNGIFTSFSTFDEIFNRHNISIFLGVTLQFFNYSKDHFQLNILYSQGLKKSRFAYVDYNTGDGSDYYAKLGSNGSYFVIQLGYPFRLIRF